MLCYQGHVIVKAFLAEELQTPSTRHIAVTACTARLPLTNPKTPAGSSRSPARTRLRPFSRSPALRGEACSHGAGAAPPRAPRWSSRPRDDLHPDQPASPSSGWSAPRARTSCQLLGRAPRTYELDHPSAVLRRVVRMTLRHRRLLLPPRGSLSTKPGQVQSYRIGTS